MENMDWKALGIMTGIAVVVCALGIVITKTVVDPMIAKAKLKKQNEPAKA